MAVCAGELEAFQDVIGTGDQSQMLSRLVSRVASLETAVADAEMRRRAIHNQLVELRGNVRPVSLPLIPLIPYFRSRHDTKQDHSRYKGHFLE